jgi:hypothetical protein
MNDDKVALGQALMFLSHLMGDLHQPMHVSRKADLGGNIIRINLNQDWGTKFPDTNLHKVWDSDLIYRLQKLQNLKTSMDIANYLIRTITDAQRTAFRHSIGIDVVVGESWDIAKMYGYGLTDGLDLKNFPTSYYDKTVKIVQDRLAIAGLRLAGFINDIADARAKEQRVLAEGYTLSDSEDIRHCLAGCIRSDLNNIAHCLQNCR